MVAGAVLADTVSKKPSTQAAAPQKAQAGMGMDQADIATMVAARASGLQHAQPTPGGVLNALPTAKTDLPLNTKPASGNYTRQGGDTIGEAVPIAVGETDTGTTVGYTDDYDEVCPYSGSTSPDVVYVFSPNTTGDYEFDICESGYDTKIYVYDTSMNLMGCNDDYCNDSAGNPYRSYLAIQNMAPGDYYIIIDGYNGDAGDYQLTVGELEPCEVECPPDATVDPEPECGDDYEDTTNGGCNSEPPVFGTIECGETICGTAGTFTYQGNAYRDTDWYMFSLAQPSPVTWTVTADFPVLIFLLDIVDCDDFGNNLSESATGGPCQEVTIDAGEIPPGDYIAFVAPSGFDGVDCSSVWVGTLECESGPCEVDCPPDATVDDEPQCEDDYEDVTNGGCNSDPPVFGAIEGGETICGTAGTYVYDEDNFRDTDWYLFTLEEETRVEWTVTAEFDLQIFLFDFQDCDNYGSNLFENASGGPCQEVSINAGCLPPGDYVAFVAPSVFEGVDCGSAWVGTLEFSDCGAAGGDSCDDPFIIDSLPYTNTGSTTDNTDTWGNASPDEWYMFTLESPALINIDLCGSNTDYDTYLHVLSDDCVTELAFNDDGPVCDEDTAPYEPSFISQEFPAGTYLICVEGYSNNSGNYDITVELGEPCELECPGDATMDPEPECGDEYEDMTNGGCNSDPPVFGSIECGETICGTAGTFSYQGGSYRDTDWFMFTLYEDSPVSWTVTAEFPVLIFLFDIVDCDNYGNVLFESATGAPCDEVTVDAGTLPPGDYIAFVAPSDFTGVDCSSIWYGTLNCNPQAVNDPVLPAEFSLSQNYPNPFNPTTAISYAVPRNSRVSLRVYNLNGETVATLVDGMVDAGTHTVEFNGADLASGVYFYTLNAGQFTETKKMILVK